MVKLWLAAGLVVCGVSTGALAQSVIAPPSGPGPVSIAPHAAPGPVIGAGIPALLLIGGIWAVRQMRRRNR